MQKISIQEALELAKKEPNTTFANQLRRSIESGALDEAAAKQGVDLSRYGRPTLESADISTIAKDDDGFLMDVGQGVAKTAGDFAMGIGSIGRKAQGAVSKGIEKVTGVEGFGMGGSGVFDAGSEQNLAAQEILAKDTPGEKVGGFVGDIASYMIPGGAAVRATKGAKLLPRALSLGASDAVVTAVKEGEFNKDSIDAAIIGAAFPIVGKGAQVAKRLLPPAPDAGGKVINSLIKPLLKDFSYGKNPGKAVAEAGITANTLDELTAGIKTVRQQTGQEISDIVSKSAVRFNATDSLKSIDEAIIAAQKAPKTNEAIIRRLQGVKDDLLQVGQDGIPARKLEDLSATELWEFNKEIGDLARWTGNASDDEITNRAIRSAYNITRAKLDKAIPGLKETSEKYANLKSAEVATEYRDKIAARHGLISFSGTQLGTAAAVTSAVVSGGAVMPILVGAGAAIATESLKSPAVKTRVAAWLASAPKKEIQKAFMEAPWLRSTLQTVLFGEDEPVKDGEDN